MCSFLLIAFLLPLASLALQMAIPVPFVRFILYGIEAASPSIAAIVLQCRRGTLLRFCRKMFHREHLFEAIVLPVSIAGLTMFGAKLIFCLLFHTDFGLGSISSAQFIIIAWALVAEEAGWRGYLEPLLTARGCDPRAAPLVTGAVWALWHYHYFLTGGMQVPVFLFLASCVIESCLYSFFMDCTAQNLVSAAMYHFAWNLFVHIFAVNPADNQGNLYPYAILTALEGLTMILFHVIKKGGKSDV